MNREDKIKEMEALLRKIKDDVASSERTLPITDEVRAEFERIPLGNIVVEKQIRRSVNVDDDGFKALMQSVEERGVLEPVLVKRVGDKYLLISGERRYRASEIAGLKDVPARILDGLNTREDILATQLIENLHREDLNPIDEGCAYVQYIQAVHPGLEFDRITNALLLMDRNPQRVAPALVDTLSTIAKYSGKSMRSILRILSLLRLPEEIQGAVQAGKLGLSPAYVFAAQGDHKDLLKIFHDFMKNPLTVDDLEKRFTAVRGASTARRDGAMAYSKLLQGLRNKIERRKAPISSAEVDRLLSELNKLFSILQRKKSALLLSRQNSAAAEQLTLDGPLPKSAAKAKHAGKAQ